MVIYHIILAGRSLKVSNESLHHLQYPKIIQFIASDFQTKSFLDFSNKRCDLKTENT